MDEPSKILIVDEDPFIRDVLTQKLEALGYRATEARNGREAVDKVAQDPPDLILLDVMMPVMDGFQACRLLKDNEDTRLIPIIIMTALHAVVDSALPLGAECQGARRLRHGQLGVGCPRLQAGAPAEIDREPPRRRRHARMLRSWRSPIGIGACALKARHRHSFGVAR